MATICGLLLTSNYKDYHTMVWLTKGVYLGNLGLALSLAFTLYTESKTLSASTKITGHMAVFLLLATIGFVTNPFKREVDILILLILAFAFHLLVAISAFSSSKENNGFWQMNKNLFLRFATSVLYSVVLFAGLSVALFSIQTLFAIKWDDEIYFRLWIIIAALFNTLFFLSGISSPIQQLNSESAYPKGLKIFTQYVLIPLASIYLIILLAYEIKILLAWELPNGTVSILILGYAVFGILSLLLVHPLRDNDDSKWIKLFSKWFYVLMVPLLVLLALAIYKRVSDYGITESRYILVALAVWLSFITIYFLVKGQEQIRIIPISLALIALIITAGPWGIAYVSKTSQQNRLLNILEEKASIKRNNEIRNLVDYLNDHHGLTTLQTFVKSDLKAIDQELQSKADTSKHNNSYQLKREARDTVLAMMNISKDYEPEDAGINSNLVKYFYNKEEDIFDVAGADKMIAFNANMNHQDKKTRTFTIGNDRFVLSIDSADKLHLKPNQEPELIFDAGILLKNLLQSTSLKQRKDAMNTYNVPAGEMSIQKETEKYRFVCRIEQMNGGLKNDRTNRATQKNLYYAGYLIVYIK
jgi:uncharacterized membrane protein SirB2